MDSPDQAPFSRLQAMLELQTEYAVHRHARQEEPLEETITRYTEWPFYHDSFVDACPAADNEEWMRCIRDSVAALPSSAGPAETFAHLQCRLLAGMQARIRNVFRQEEEKTRGGFAGFTYEYHPEYFGPAQPELLTLHFRNAFAPNGPFEHEQALRDGLRAIVRRARAERPGVARTQCATWLNNVAPFTRLFPSEWASSGTDCPLEGHTGWWGQFTDRTGGLHAARVAAFRGTWSFRFPNRHCRCSLDALEEHLEKHSRAERKGM